jgi:dTMP kinase
VAWVRSIEIDRFGLPAPHAQLLLRVPVAVAAERSAHRERTETDRGRDTWEADQALQTRVGTVYDELAEADWLSAWHVVDGTTSPDTTELAKRLAE